MLLHGKFKLYFSKAIVPYIIALSGAGKTAHGG